MDESKIVTNEAGGAVAFVGPDATRLYQATVLRSALGLLSKGIQPTRGYTMKRALHAASQITGKQYASTGKARRLAVQDAQADLKRWCDTMAAALPKETR